MEEKLLITCKEAGDLTGFDPSGIHSQVESDIKTGENGDNWNGLKAGRKVLIPFVPLFKKLFGGVGPVILITEKAADILVKYHMAEGVEECTQIR